MAKNLLGAVGGFLESFTNAREGKKQREENEKYKKAMTAILELQIDQANRTMQAQTKVGQMSTPQRVGSTAPEFQFPEEGTLGEIQQTKPGGPVMKPGMSFLEIMGDPEGRIAAIESGMAGQMQQADQLTAQSELVQGMRESGVPPLEFLQSPEGSALAVRAGMNPSEFMRTQGGAADELLKVLQIQLGGMQLSNAQSERQTKEQAAIRTHRQLEVQTRTTVEHARELADLNDKLEATALETGQPFGELYRAVIAGGAPILESMGFDTGKARETVADFDRFNKLSTDFAMGLLEKYNEIGTLTDTKLQTLQKSMVNIGAAPGANRLVIADALQEVLDSAAIEDIEVPERAEAEALIKSLKGRGVRQQGEAVVDLPGIAKMTLDQIRTIPLDQVGNWSAEQKAALESRLDELGL